MKDMNSSDKDARPDRKLVWVFTPSRTDPKDLESILVQREEMLRDAVERVRESALTDHKHHLLFVGPRGLGKTHLITLIVSRLSQDNALRERLRIAWLNEDETSTTFLDLLARIHAALEKRYPQDFHEQDLHPAYEMKPADALAFVSRKLLESLADRTLVVVTENLDSIFEALGEAGQKQLRAFIQEHSQICLVATAQRLVEDLSSRTSPFFGFFQTEHLKRLDVAQATKLLQNIAQLHGQQQLVDFLATPRGRSRVQAIHHLSGGNHRIYVVLSQFITRDSIEALLDPFMKMVDELTPYYQERIRWLPPLQRKIVEFLCTCEGTVPVKEIARRLFSTPQTISSQLQGLREKGYVEANQRGRESLYEISEPLMRICVEVKENLSHQPLRLLVDFLRAWYDEDELNKRREAACPASAAFDYLESALLRNQAEGSLRKRILLDDLQVMLANNEIHDQLDWLIPLLGDVPEGLLLAIRAYGDRKLLEALEFIDDSLTEANTPSIRAICHNVRADIHLESGDWHRAEKDYTAALEHNAVPVEFVARCLLGRGLARRSAGQAQIAIGDFTSLLELQNTPTDLVARALLERAGLRIEIGDPPDAISDCSSLIGLRAAPTDMVAKARLVRARAHEIQGNAEAAISDYDAFAEMPDTPPEKHVMARLASAMVHYKAGNIQAATVALTSASGLPGATPWQIAAALNLRGHIQYTMEDYSLAKDDFTAVVAVPGAPVEQVAWALYWHGVAERTEGSLAASRVSFDSVTLLEGAPKVCISASYASIAALEFADGRWEAGMQALERSLAFGASEELASSSVATDLIGLVLDAALYADRRSERARELLRIYNRHQALPILGEGLIQHLGRIPREGALAPSQANLEDWAAAWEEAGQDVQDFSLSLRLLRVGIEFLKAGAESTDPLLTLASPERAILLQVFGLVPKES